MASDQTSTLPPGPCGPAAQQQTLPTAQDWYSVTAVGEGITLITEPHVHPLLRANLWHIRGRTRDVLIDAGLGVAPLAPLLRHLFGQEPTLLLTHAHLDHLGAAHEFADRRAHPMEPVDSPLPGSLDSEVLARTLGLDPSVLPLTLPPLLLSALPWPGYDPAAYQLQPAPATRYLNDGDTVELGNRTLMVLHLPGHTPGGIALYDPKAQALFSGDVVYDIDEDEELLDNIHGADIDDYIVSMERLARLPVRQVYPGHGPVFGPDRLHQLIDRYLDSRRPGRHRQAR